MLLELTGPLVGLAVGAALLKNRPVLFLIDNQAGVFTWNKGYSRKDPLSSTVVKAVYDLSRHLNCSVFIKKVARCSTRGGQGRRLPVKRGVSRVLLVQSRIPSRPNEDSSSSGEVAHLASGGPQLGDKDRARAERKGH